MQPDKPAQSRLNIQPYFYLVVALVVLLLASTTLFIFAQEGSESNPSVQNTKPSGFAAFARLLQAEGYVVVQDRDQRPRLQPDDLVVLVEIDRFTFDFAESTSGVERIDPVQKTVNTHVENGGTALTYRVDDDFGEATQGQTTETVYLVDSPYQVTLGGLADLEEQNNRLIAVHKYGEGIKATLTDSLGVSNRFLGKEQNAAYHLNVVRSLAPPGSRIVFAEASFGNILDRTLSDDMGAWVKVAFWQFMAVVAVAVYAAGRRFGTPVPDRIQERGTNELLLSMGGILKRAKKHDQALMILLDDAYERIRTTLKAPIGTDPAALTKQSPPALATTILKIRQSYGAPIKTVEAVRLARTLEAELEALESESRSRRLHPGKIK